MKNKKGKKFWTNQHLAWQESGAREYIKKSEFNAYGAPLPPFFWNLLSSPVNENLLLLAAGAV
jgi:hypothetical protein